MSEQARIELTEILAIMLGFGNVSDLSMQPTSMTLRTGEPHRDTGIQLQYRYRVEALQYAGAAFIPVWARGYFPAEAVVGLFDNHMQSRFCFNDTQWGMQSYQPIFFCAPHWLEANASFELGSTHPGWLTLYGMNIYPSGAVNAARIGEVNKKAHVKTIDKAQALEKAQRLAMGLQKLTEVMKP